VKDIENNIFFKHTKKDQIKLGYMKLGTFTHSETASNYFKDNFRKAQRSPDNKNGYLFRSSSLESNQAINKSEKKSGLEKFSKTKVSFYSKETKLKINKKSFKQRIMENLKRKKSRFSKVQWKSPKSNLNKIFLKKSQNSKLKNGKMNKWKFSNSFLTNKKISNT
jgi:hypothetical protein